MPTTAYLAALQRASFSVVCYDVALPGITLLSDELGIRLLQGTGQLFHYLTDMVVQASVDELHQHTCKDIMEATATEWALSGIREHLVHLRIITGL